MNPRVSRIERAREQGHRLPDREDRGQARGRLPPRRGAATTSPARRRRASSRRSTTSSPRSRGGRSRSCPGAAPVLGTQMQSVGEVMAIGRTFAESLQKALRSLETGRLGLNCDPAEHELDALADDELVRAAAVPDPRAPLPGRGRAAPVRVGRAPARGHRHRPVVPRPDPADRRGARPPRASVGLAAHDAAPTGGTPSASASPTRSSRTSGTSTEADGARARGSRPACASPTRPSTRARPSSPRTRRTTTAPTRTRTRSRRSTKPAVVILGSGPNRIGQGVEFDYCCVHAAFALRDAGFETVMVNCNPETVSTDYDTSDRLFFEPLTEEDVLNVCERLQDATRASSRGVIVALGGQTPLKLAHVLEAGRHPDARHEPGVDRRGRGPRAVQRAVRPARHPAARRRHRRPTSTTRSRSRTTSATRCSCARRTCSAAARCRSSTTTPTCAARWPSSRDTGSLGREGGLSAERPALDRPVPRGRDRGRRRRAPRPHRRVRHRRR